MSKNKKKPEKKSNHTVTITREQTQSVTGSLTESITATDLSGDGAFSIEKLLGKDFEPDLSGAKFLIKIHNNSVLSKILDRIGFESTNKELLFNNSVVVGPLEEADIQKLIQSKLLSRNDMIYKFQDRWKGVMEVFQDIKFEDLRKEEITSTYTETAQYSDAQEDGEINIQEDEIDKRQQLGQDTLIKLKDNLKKEKTQETVQSFGVNESRTERPEKSKLVPLLGVIALVVAGAFLFQYVNQSQTKESPFKSGQDNPLRKNVESAWPTQLRPLSPSSLFESDDDLVSKVFSIMKAYDKGAHLVTPENYQILKSLSAPATASQEARILAANQLAAFYLSSLKVKESLNVLKPIIQSNQTDLTTIINLSLTFLVNRNYAEARELAASALRLCPKGTCWIPYTLMGWIQGSDGKWGDSELNFETALAESSQNPVIYGVWLRTLGNNRPKKLLSVLRRAMWSDFDLIIDSPIKAPIASAVFLNQSARGFKEASRAYKGELNQGHKAFLNWFLAKMESVPPLMTAAEVSLALQKESDAQSLVYLAYIHKEEGRYNLAAEVLNKGLNRIEPRVKNVSWPWTLSADIQLLRGVVDQSSLHYQAALSRNSRDMSAIYGLGLVLRENQDYKGAKRKIDEVVLAYPSFIPAKLRIHRYKWQGIYK
jgi:tetratricopeptide (TPR) repeat protein